MKIHLPVILFLLLSGLNLSAQTSPTESVISGSGAIVRLTAAKDKAAPASQLGEPDAAKKLIAVQIVIDNRKGTEDISITPMFFKLKDEEGGVYETGLAESTDQPTLKSGSVDAGDLVKGWVSFEVPVALKAKTLRLRYETSDQKTAWLYLSSFVK